MDQTRKGRGKGKGSPASSVNANQASTSSNPVSSRAIRSSTASLQRNLTRKVRRVIVEISDEVEDLIDNVGLFFTSLAEEAESHFQGRLIVVYLGSLALDFSYEKGKARELKNEVRDWVFKVIKKKGIEAELEDVIVTSEKIEGYRVLQPKEEEVKKEEVKKEEVKKEKVNQLWLGQGSSSEMNQPPGKPTTLKGKHGSDHHTEIDTATDQGDQDPTCVCRSIFRNHEDYFIQMVGESPAGSFILIAVAWFTNIRILNELIKAKERNVLVAIVVQKEDFLRPDMEQNEGWKINLRDAYGRLGKLSIFDGEFPLILKKGVTASSGIFYDDNKDCVAAVRCVGNYNVDKSPSFARMHHKFAVFGKVLDFQEVIAEKVWTGSYNFSRAAEASFENVVVISSKAIATSFLKEFAGIFFISEPLNWETTWVAPTMSYTT